MAKGASKKFLAALHREMNDPVKEGCERREGKIRSTYLSEVRWTIDIEGMDGGWAQGFGNYVGTPEFQWQAMAKVLEALDVDRWEKLIGLKVRVEGTNSSLHRIGLPTRNQWFDIVKFSKAYNRQLKKRQKEKDTR